MTLIMTPVQTWLWKEEQILEKRLTLQSRRWGIKVSVDIQVWTVCTQEDM